MYRTQGRLILSATDLVNFASCEHLTQLQLGAAAGMIALPDETNELVDVQRKRGAEHEQRYLEVLRRSGREVVELAQPGRDFDALVAADAATAAAMEAGADVIYQAALFDGRWLGYADFLLRVESPSDLGAFSYEVADTKLARTVKGSAILQMCSYAERIATLQGRESENVHVVLGDMTTESLRLRDYAAYYRSLKARFEATALNESEVVTYPEPVEHCGVCQWKDACVERRVVDDHLSLVARMRGDQIRKLGVAGITTVVELAQSSTAVVAGIGRLTVEALRGQARLQVAQRETTTISYELLPVVMGAGLGLLPLPSAGDLFFDIEGDPFVEDGNLDYLLGVLEVRPDGTPAYHAFWAHSRGEEKAAFEQFVDFVTERLVRDPSLHIYHYAEYEVTALKRMMSLHGTRESEIDNLLRGQVLVDLYRVVRQGVRVSTESYSLKKIEPLYTSPRTAEIHDGGSSIVAYEAWLDRREQQLLDNIVDYNQEDCASTWKLRDWLEGRRVGLVDSDGVVLARPDLTSSEVSVTQRGDEVRLQALTEALCADVPDDPLDRTPQEQARWLLGQLLQWHRREDKPEWWSYYNRLEKTDQELFEDHDSIGELELVGAVRQVARSVVYAYRFDPSQEHKLQVGQCPRDPRTRASAGEVVRLDSLHGIIELKRGKASCAPHPRSLIPEGPIQSKPLRESIERLARWVVHNGIDGPGPKRAARDLLMNLGPRIAGSASGAAVRHAGESVLMTARRAVADLDASYLAVQGPPGSGKTYTGARAIVDLVRAGQRVGICGPSHRSIVNLLDAVIECAAAEGLVIRALQKALPEDGCTSPLVTVTSSNDQVEAALRDGTVDVVAGTAWLFAREGLADTLDTLFVDEAGQVSLANAMAIAGAARNLVLLGDPQQLSQPSNGTHPRGAERSALGHVVGDASTIAPDRGLLLDTTWRMHPAICEFISDVAYDGRLHADPSCAVQALEAGDGVGGTGLRYVPVTHSGNRTSSIEEARRIRSLFDGLLGRQWTDAHGLRRRLTLADILVVAPYNAQVALLARELPAGARVGTVDKFQGQEAPVVFFSTGASSAANVPRGLEFLFSLNRLNVAISRARGLAILVGSSTLLDVSCRTPEQMRLASAFHRFVELVPVSTQDATLPICLIQSPFALSEAPAA
jgi:predicted RecB family nuclease